jgi:lysophospholipase L1-like esterase
VTITGQGISDWVNQGTDTTRCDKLVQATDARRPSRFKMRGRLATFHNGGVGQLYLQKAGFGGGTPAIPQPFTAMALVRTMGTGTTVFAARSAGGAMQTLGSSWPKDFRGNLGTNLTATGVLGEHEICLLEMEANGASSKLYKNGVQVASGNLNTGSWDGLTIGDTAGLTAHYFGQVGEFLIVAGGGAGGIITPTERALYYNNYYKPFWKCGSVGTPVMWFGDSVFYGIGDTAPNKGPRSRFFDEWNSTPVGAKWPTEIGDIKDGTYPGDQHHCISGHTIADMATDVTTLLGSGNSYHPKVVVILVGAGECRGFGPGYVAEPSSTSTLDAYQNLIGDIATREPGVQVVCCSLLDMDPARFATPRANVNDFNAGLAARLSSLASLGYGIHFADLRNGLGDYGSGTNYDADGLHPNAGGHALLQSALRQPVADAFQAAA